MVPVNLFAGWEPRHPDIENGPVGTAGEGAVGKGEGGTEIYTPCCAALSHFSRVRLFATRMDYNPPGSSVHGILQARTLEWAAISFSSACMHAKSLQSCPTLCDPIDRSPPGSSVHRILQARTLEWAAMSFSNT